MGEFDTIANISLEIANGELSSIRNEIESELSNISVGIDASVSGPQSQRQPRDPSSGQFMSIEGVEQRVIEQTEVQVEVLEDIKDTLEGMSVGGGGGGGGTSLSAVSRGLGMGVGGGLGLTALGIGAGVGIGAFGIGAGAGAAQGEFAQEEFTIQTGNIAVTPVLEGPFLENPQFTLEPQIGPEAVAIGEDAFQFSPRFTPEMFNIDPEIAIGDNAFQFNPQFGPENFDFSPTLGEDVFQFGPDDFDLSPSFDIGDITIDPSIEFAPTIQISPSISVTGVDLSGLSVDLRKEILNSRQFQNELDSALSDAEGDIEDRIINALE